MMVAVEVAVKVAVAVAVGSESLRVGSKALFESE